MDEDLDDEWSGDFMASTPPCCPKCRSNHVEPRNVAKRFGGAIGAVVGTTGGVAAAVAGAEAGALGGPIAVLLGAAGVVIEGIVGGARGCAAGSRLGEAIDRSILHNHRCCACGHTFGGTSD